MSASMSSMTMSTIISSSTTRMRRWDSNLSIGSDQRHRNVDRADDAAGGIIEIHGTFQFVGQTTLNHLRTKPFSGGRCNSRTVAFLPPHVQPVAAAARLDGPSDQDGSRLIGERAVLDRVGRELMDRNAKGQD